MALIAAESVNRDLSIKSDFSFPAHSVRHARNQVLKYNWQRGRYVIAFHVDRLRPLLVKRKRRRLISVQLLGQRRTLKLILNVDYDHIALNETVILS